MLIGMRLCFREDGSGTMEEWGFDHFHLNPEYVSVTDFTWISVAERAVNITHRGETRTVRYDFRTCRNEYGIPELRVFEPGMTPGKDGEVGFWLSPFSLVYDGPDRPPGGALARLWRKLKHGGFSVIFIRRLEQYRNKISSQLPASFFATARPM